MTIDDFLYCQTPHGWVAAVNDNLDILLIDHANCEKKAASTALNLMYRYVDKPEMLLQLSKLAREELRHFEQVVGLLNARGIEYANVSSARYAGEMRKGVRTHEPARLVDMMVVSAIVEARSCERFERVIPVLDNELADFYGSLLKSEARHFGIYLEFAEQYAERAADTRAIDLDARIAFFLAEDQRLVESSDPDFRFHSGVPEASMVGDSGAVG
ncbi:MAG: tRNA-(ms[2]io[6]A)-hydroxylase [Candidatus Azotimanducaceae bacterium]|jgi:tRNA-(ms[2]io[6]A)-hydroxylase